jgi:hypothetical protein
MKYWTFVAYKTLKATITISEDDIDLGMSPKEIAAGLFYDHDDWVVINSGMDLEKEVEK